MRVVCAAMILRNHRSTRSESLLDRAGSSISVRVLDQGRPRSLDPDLRLPEKSGFDLLCGKKPEVLQLHRFSDSETVLILYWYESPQFAAYIWKTIGFATIFMKLYVGNFSLDMTERTAKLGS